MKNVGSVNSILKFLFLDLKRSNIKEEITAKNEMKSPYQPNAKDDKILTTNSSKKVLSRFFSLVLFNSKIDSKIPRNARFNPRYSS